VTVDKPVYGGYCLAAVDGKIIFIPDAIPGEEAAVKITRESKNYSFGEIVEILKPSPLRITPPCPLYPQCGGCSYLCAGYESELAWKKMIIADSLTRVGKISGPGIPPIETLHHDRFHYRSHGTVKLFQGRAGLFERGTNSLIPFQDKGCLLLEQSLNRAMMDHTGDGTGYRLAIDASGKIFFSDREPRTMTEREHGLEYSRDIWNFFQANRFLREKMLTTVLGYAELTGEDTFLDIGCGVGFFTLALARGALGGTGVDMDRSGIGHAVHNAKINGITNVSFQALAAADIHPGRHSPRAIIADPPRAGLDKKARKTINAIKAPVLVYVSCNPSTFSRDTADFIKEGYTLDRLTFIDMFPGTHHIELISRFTR